MIQGLITRSQSGFYTVETSQGPIVCQLRGRLKRGRREGDVATVGDCVRITPLDDGSGVIDIYYMLNEADNDLCTINVAVSDDGGSSWTVTAKSLSGDIGENISCGN